MKIKDIMTDKVSSLKADMTLMDAARKMKELDVGAIPVVGESKDLLGIITDRDIVIKSIAFGKDPKTTRIEAVMTKDVLFVTPDTDVDDAVKSMSKAKIRRLPVVKNKKLVGMVSLGDIAANNKASFFAGGILEKISVPIGPKRKG